MQKTTQAILLLCILLAASIYVAPFVPNTAQAPPIFEADSDSSSEATMLTSRPTNHSFTTGVTATSPGNAYDNLNTTYAQWSYTRGAGYGTSDGSFNFISYASPVWEPPRGAQITQVDFKTSYRAQSARLPATAWLSPTNAYSSNDVYSTSNTPWVTTCWKTFGFSTGGWSGVNKVEVLVERKAASGGNENLIIILSNDAGASFSAVTFTDTVTETTDTIKTIDVTSAYSWTPAMVTNIAVAVTLEIVGTTSVVSIDHIQIRVTPTGQSAITNSPTANGTVSANATMQISYMVGPSSTKTILKGPVNDLVGWYNMTWENQPEPNNAIWNWEDIGSIKFMYERVDPYNPDLGGLIYIAEVWMIIHFSLAQIHISPKAQGTQPLTIKLNATSVEELYGFEFKLYYNTRALTPSSISLGPYLNTTAGGTANTFGDIVEVDDTLGVIWATQTIRGDIAGGRIPTGSWGTLATITFTKDADGNSNFDLESKLIGFNYKAVTLVSGETSKSSYVINHQVIQPVHDVAVTNIIPSVINATQGDTITADVTVVNQGDYKETFDLALYTEYTTTAAALIETKTVTGLSPGGTQVVTFTWDTTGFSGKYSLTAVADTLGPPTESDTQDNILTRDKITLRPNGNGLYTAWTGTYTDWDDLTPDNDTTYVVATATNWNETSTMEDVSMPYTGSVSMVTLNIVAKRPSGDEQVRLMLVIGGVGYNGSLVAPTTSYALYKYTWASNPALGRAWTWADVNALQAGVRSQRIGALWSGDIRITQMYIEVESKVWIGPDVKIYEAVPSPTRVYAGDTVSISATVQNIGPRRVSFSVYCYANRTETRTLTLLGTQAVSNLDSWAYKTVGFSWGTTGYANGYYSIYLNTSSIAQEIILDDNKYVVPKEKEVYIGPDISVLDVTSSHSTVYAGTPVYINVTVKNEGSQTVATFDVKAFANSSSGIITQLGSTQTVTSLTSNAMKELKFTWDTTSYSNGNYVVFANITHLAGEFEVSDNIRYDGTVYIGPDVSVVSVAPATNTAYPGDLVSITVTVKNDGNQTIPTFDVKAYANRTSTGAVTQVGLTQTVNNLAAGASTPVVITWNTAGYAYDTYVLFANATKLVGETDTIDNTKYDGTVYIGPDVAVLSVVPSPTNIYAGDPVTIEVTVKNEGAQTVTSLTVKTYVNRTSTGTVTLLDTRVISSLTSGSSTFFDVIWTTTGFANDTYTAYANAPPLVGETDTADNTRYCSEEDNVYIGPDLAVSGITYVSKTKVYQGETITARVKVLNQGSRTITSFVVKLYANETWIMDQTVTNLASGIGVSKTFTWNTLGFSSGNYNLTARITPITGETDINDNTQAYSTLIRVKLLGDINDDGIVDAYDMNILGKAYDSQEAYRSTPRSPNWNAEADFNADNFITIADLQALTSNYGKTG